MKWLCYSYYLHGASFALMMFGSLFDIFVIIYADRIKNMYDDEPESDEKTAELQALRKTNADEATKDQDEDVRFSVTDSHFD